MKKTWIYLVLFSILISCSSHKRKNINVMPTPYSSAGLPLNFKDVLDRFDSKVSKRCYDPYLKKIKKIKNKNPKKGKLEYKITFDNEGVVQAVQQTKKSKIPTKISSCVQSGLKKLSFGKSDFGVFEIIYPVKFNYKKLKNKRRRAGR